jgi:hypothetical protein
MVQKTEPTHPIDIYLVSPILPGQAEAWRRFVQELQGPRRSEWERWCQRVGLNRLRVWLQSDQNGTTVLLEGRIRAGKAGLIDHNVPFDRWLREQLFSFHGVDIAQFEAKVKQELVLDITTESKGEKHDQS